jgi:hypothetical protein
METMRAVLDRLAATHRQPPPSHSDALGAEASSQSGPLFGATGVATPADDECDAPTAPTGEDNGDATAAPARSAPALAEGWVLTERRCTAILALQAAHRTGLEPAIEARWQQYLEATEQYCAWSDRLRRMEPAAARRADDEHIRRIDRLVREPQGA